MNNLEERLKVIREKGTLAKKDKNVSIDVYEKQNLEYQIELALRSHQLEQAREELDATKVKNRELQYVIENYKRNFTKSDDDIRTAKKFNKDWEVKYKEAIESKTNLLRQNEDLATDNITLKQINIALESENSDIKRQLEDLISKNWCSELYKADFIKAHEKLKALITQVNKISIKLENQQEGVRTQMLKLEHTQQTMKSIDFLKQDLIRLKKEKEVIQKEHIYYKSKHNQLEELLKNTKIKPDNDESHFFFSEWKMTIKRFAEHIRSQSTITNNLINKYKMEKDINCKLIHKQIIYEETIESLKKKKCCSAETQTTDISLIEDNFVVTIKSEAETPTVVCDILTEEEINI